MEVIKSVTPDLDGNSVGATINLITPSAFGADGRFFSGQRRLRLLRTQRREPYGAAVATGLDLRRRQVGHRPVGELPGTRVPVREHPGRRSLGRGGRLSSRRVHLRDYEIERIRTGFSGQPRVPADRQRPFYFRNLYNEFKDTEYQPESSSTCNAICSTRRPPPEPSRKARPSAPLRGASSTVDSDSTLGAIFYLDQWTVEPAITGSAEQDTPSDRVDLRA